MRFEPVEPLRHRCGAAALEHGLDAPLHRRRNAISIAGRLAIRDRGGLLSVRCTPVEGSAEQQQNRILPGVRELGCEQLADERVAAIPLSLAIQSDHEPVRTLQRIEDSRRVGRPEDRVAERPGQLIEDARLLEQSQLSGRQLREELRLQELDDKWVVPGERTHASGTRTGGLGRQCGQVQAGRPALGVVDQLADEVVRGLNSRRVQERPCLGLIHAQVIRTELPHDLAGAKARERKGCPVPGRQRQLRLAGDVIRERDDRVDALRIGNRMHVIEHENDRRFHPCERRPEARDDRRLD